MVRRNNKIYLNAPVKIEFDEIFLDFTVGETGNQELIPRGIYSFEELRKIVDLIFENHRLKTDIVGQNFVLYDPTTEITRFKLNDKEVLKSGRYWILDFMGRTSFRFNISLSEGYIFDNGLSSQTFSVSFIDNTICPSNFAYDNDRMLSRSTMKVVPEECIRDFDYTIFDL